MLEVNTCVFVKIFLFVCSFFAVQKRFCGSQAHRINFNFCFVYFSSSQDSTDTESSATSTAREPTQPAAVTVTDHKGQQSLSSGASHSGLQLPVAPCLDVDAREGPRTNQAFTSITIATRRRTPSPDHSSSPGPPLSPSPEPLRLSQLSGETLPGLEINMMNEAAAAAAGQSSRLHMDGLQLGGGALPSVQISELPQPEVTRSPRPGSPPTPGHVSYAHITLSPKSAVGHSLAPAGQPRHSSSLLSPDEGLGLSSPPEWSEHREPMKERVQPSSSPTTQFQPMSDVPEGRGSSLFTTFRPPTTVTSPRDATRARVRNSESPGKSTNTHTQTHTHAQFSPMPDASSLCQFLSCCLTNLTAVKNFSTSLRQKVAFSQTPRWRAATLVQPHSEKTSLF